MSYSFFSDPNTVICDVSPSTNILLYWTGIVIVIVNILLVILYIQTQNVSRVPCAHVSHIVADHQSIVVERDTWEVLGNVVISCVLPRKGIVGACVGSWICCAVAKKVHGIHGKLICQEGGLCGSIAWGCGGVGKHVEDRSSTDPTSILGLIEARTRIIDAMSRAVQCLDLSNQQNQA